MKKKLYKLVVKTPYETYVRKKGSNKESLIDYGMGLSKKHPKWKITVVDDSIRV
jgi:hypothetical protein